MNEYDREFERVSAIIGHVEYSSHMYVGIGRDSRIYLQAFAVNARCAVNGTAVHWRGRKWYLSPHMTDSEIVSTAFKAFLTAEEHECRERFRYKGQRIFGPHMDVDTLADALSSGALKESVRT